MRQARGDVRQVVIGVFQVLERSGTKDIVARVRAGVRAMGYVFSNEECSAWLKPFQHARGQRSDAGRTQAGRDFKHESDAVRTQDGRESDSRANNESLVTNTYPKLANARSVTPKARPVAQIIPEVAFEDKTDEHRVSALLALENPSGRMLDRKRLALRSLMRSRLDEVGPACWRFGVDQALAKGVGWAYAARVIVNNPVPPQPYLARSAPSRSQKTGASAPPSPEKMALYEERLNTNAVREQPNILGRIDPSQPRFGRPVRDERVA